MYKEIYTFFVFVAKPAMNILTSPEPVRQNGNKMDDLIRRATARNWGREP